MPTDTTTVLPFPRRDSRAQRPADRSGVRLELTSRGRALVTAIAFVLGLVVAALALLVFDVPAALAGAGQEQHITVTVEAGDTLWDLAEQHAPEGVGQQEYIAQVRAMNHLPTGRVTAGQQLDLPVGEGVER
ncbi:LysM peptidoglycan-binding domain-containing protein [Brachybacterium sp. p3-SID1565]|uniref:LysM peptidoglycan-binding domain-containing protein n=1 Tax=Brachybacterium epidermidis TaxID=2781983 RepID=A0ABR9W1P7_9MICO|nr:MULTISPECIES: LysM peptidoglycan-binding domain-containing protein [Brachybacterium]MBE9404357.1 LysM peptidoglycan-binding domain-containing protein [Brachybacterium epidermidis]MCT1385280.1 LysM peptidoglycan-binding domain-containing protein [Brachybacterium sp. p3-SID1565]MCT1775685.1 LysM peptidoglycan-binding domain-containing protein [Brachybacterium sp. p3-SID957]